MPKKILILGGGFGGVRFYKTLHDLTHDSGDYLFQVVNRWNYFLFYPMLHEVATGSVDRSHITQPLREIMNCCLETFYHTDAEHIDFKNKQVKTAQGMLIYDFLCVGLGATGNFFGVKGAAEHTLQLKDIASAIALRNTIIARFEAATKSADADERKKLLHFVIVGGGSTGVELAGQLADVVFHEFKNLYQEIDYHEVKITLIQGGDRLIPQCVLPACKMAVVRLAQQGVAVQLNAVAKEITASAVYLADGNILKTKTVMWTAGVASPLRGMVDDEYLNESGYFKTRDTLQLVGHDEVFIAGDNAGVENGKGTRAPQTAQAAVGEGHVAALNCFALMSNKPLKPFSFKSKGDIMPIGDWYAVAQFGSFVFGGRFAWWLRRTIFLTEMWSWMNRLKIVADWTLNIFMPRDTSQL
ncbi:MAG: NADH dehydrogenase (Ubiquinone) [Candidatus Magasanikbacteria bacterium GW2011_GWA2_45_39]|uniref:NADH:ubiquinone reductase (non-electrogenic) n=2 Tax=Candidatus Magasanikiibacteriota TaxID=1752731 RepID=A0A0G1N0E9_9BACT|nr:MAG: NADH dehydrogenase (Ubiquinone) [Candidatus Magasanikbacteria bacterium GW2011_GWA2_45_39]KKU13832.1 MAG: NADH dehydrogenase (Ubiquinone) [Candidatus Magasanikbacteria bacterium GW2011_GWC2_45_8]HBW74139.1 hypothetical protein [Candidatus Magasanikbacteria bacterium]